MKTAVIILGHGSRGNGNDGAIKRVVEAIKMNHGRQVVEYAFLQYVQPTPDEALDRCVRQGAKKIVIVPFFMQSGVHVTKDIPVFLEKARKQYPTLDIRVTDYVGSHPLMTQIVLDLIGTRKEQQ